MFVLVLLGAGIIVLLGLAHAVFTYQSTPTGGPMMPTNRDVREAMSVDGGLGLAPHIKSNLWKAWIGFNYSHSLGVVVVGLLIGIPVLSVQTVPLDNFLWLACALILPWIYLWLSIRYWFEKPTQGIATAACLVLIGCIGQAALG